MRDWLRKRIMDSTDHHPSRGGALQQLREAATLQWRQTHSIDFCERCRQSCTKDPNSCEPLDCYAYAGVPIVPYIILNKEPMPIRLYRKS